MIDFLFHPEAQQEYEAARIWYRERSERAAARFEAEIERVLGVIGQHPDTYPHYDDEHRYTGTRRYVASRTVSSTRSNLMGFTSWA